MEPTTTTDAAIPAKRPLFLTILCILSFVGIGFSLISGIMSFLSYSALATAGNALEGVAAQNGAKAGEAANALANVMGLDYHKWALVALIQAILNLPILFGVFMMWKQKKLGYFIYAPFEIIQAAMPLIMGLGLIGGLSAILGLIFAVVFVVLYGLNLKHMSGLKADGDKSEKPAAANQKQSPAAAAVKGGTYYEVRVSNVTCIPVAATFKVGLTVTAKKFVSDAKTGKVKEEMINDEIQIGMLKDGKEIYLKSYKFTKTITSLNLVLSQKPDKIGIDPYNKLPEKP